uniref:Ig-like domain-containing protein n=1 Tax=Reinekea sp. TaxID=1970455 RepID=UPI002A809D7B
MSRVPSFIRGVLVVGLSFLAIACNFNEPVLIVVAPTPSLIAPVMADQTLSGLAFTTTVQDTISFSDADSSTLTWAVTAQGSHGTVTITDTTTGAFDYALSSADALAGDSFTVQVSDATTTVSAVITLAFADATAPVVAFTPLDNAANVALATNLVLTSDDPLNSASVSVQSSDGACSGSLQLSGDNFTSCLALTGLPVTNLARTVTLTPAVTLTDNTLYKLRATTALTNTFGTAGSATEQSFTTLDIDQPPVMADQTLSSLAFAEPVQDIIAFSDADSSAFTWAVTAQGLQGTVTITDANTGAFDYTLTSADALNGDSFTVQVSDGTTSVSAVITLAFADATAPVVAFTPLDNAVNVALATNLVLTSADPLNSASVSVQSSDGACSGSLQLSGDNFTSCLALTGLPVPNLARTVTLTPAVTRTDHPLYKLRATT